MGSLYGERREARARGGRSQYGEGGPGLGGRVSVWSGKGVGPLLGNCPTPCPLNRQND